MKVEPTVQAITTIGSWFTENFLEESSAWDMLPQLVADFPEDLGRGFVKSIQAIELISIKEMLLTSLSQSKVSVEITVNFNLSLYASKEDYYQSEEVREYFGKNSQDFSGIYTDMVSNLKLSYELVLLSQPSMVLKSKLKSLAGNKTKYDFIFSSQI